jgi:hypothetical protein
MVERLDVAAPRWDRRRRNVEGAGLSRRHALMVLAAGAIVVALLYAGFEARDAARKADATAGRSPLPSGPAISRTSSPGTRGSGTRVERRPACTAASAAG